MGLALNGTFYGTHWNLATACGKHLHILCRDEDTETQGGEGAYPQYTARGPWSLFTILLQGPPPAPLWMRARACVWLCVSQVWARTHLTSFMSTADREEEKTGIFIPMRAWRFGVILAFKVALEDTCMLLAWGCHRQHLFLCRWKCPSKALLCTLLDFHTETLDTAGIRQLRGLRYMSDQMEQVCELVCA